MKVAKTNSDATNYGLSSHKNLFIISIVLQGILIMQVIVQMETPPSYYSRASSVSKISSSHNPTYSKVIDEEGGYDDRKELSRKTDKFIIVILWFILIFNFFCFIICAASLHYKPQLNKV